MSDYIGSEKCIYIAIGHHYRASTCGDKATYCDKSNVDKYFFIAYGSQRHKTLAW